MTYEYDERERIPWDLLDFGTFDANQCGICHVRGSWSWAWEGEGKLNEDTICRDCDKVFVWDEANEEYKRRPRCRPPVGPPKENEPNYDTTTFLWNTIEGLLNQHKPTTQQRFRRWKQKSELYDGEHKIELDYRQLKPVGIWMYWAIRPCDNFSWVEIRIKSGSPIEMEWCEFLPEDVEEEDQE